MARLRVTSDYRGVRGFVEGRVGRLENVSLSKGDIIDGDLADWAVKNDLPVEEVTDEPAKPVKKAAVKKTTSGSK